MPDIDPTDVLPVNNLPAPSAPWGRAMEKRLRDVEKRLVAGGQDIAGQNRNTAATLQGLSEQLVRASETISAVITTFNIGSSPYPTLTLTPPKWATHGVVSSSMTRLPGGSGPGGWGYTLYSKVGVGTYLSEYEFSDSSVPGLGGDKVNPTLVPVHSPGGVQEDLLFSIEAGSFTSGVTVQAEWAVTVTWIDRAETVE